MLEKIANYFDRFSMLPLHPPVRFVFSYKFSILSWRYFRALKILEEKRKEGKEKLRNTRGSHDHPRNNSSISTILYRGSRECIEVSGSEKTHPRIELRKEKKNSCCSTDSQIERILFVASLYIYIYIAFDEQSERIIHAPLLKPLIKTRWIY